MSKAEPKAKSIIRDLTVFVCLVLSLAALLIGNQYMSKQAEKQEQLERASQNAEAERSAKLPDVAHKGIWLWKAPSELTDEEMSDMLSLLSADNITDVYIDVSSYIDFYEEPDPAIKQEKMDGLQKSLKAFIRNASGYNIGVHALAGQTSWGLSSNAYIPPLFVDFVKSYNESSASNEQLKGLQFDIETYNDEAFDADKKASLTQYMAMVESVTQRYRDHNLDISLGFAIPYWFDNENGNIPEITLHRKTAPVAYHLYDSLNTLPNAYTVIMDYRNTTEGSDGSIAHAQNEIVYASKYAPNVKVIIGQETTDVEPQKITFYDKNFNDLTGALQRISNSYKPFSAYNGIAIHDYDGYTQLRQKRVQE